jgi:PAS domain-containing protein
MSTEARNDPKSRAHGSLDTIARVFGLVVIALGLIVLSGWFFKVSGLVAIIPSTSPIALSSILAFICLGASTLSRHDRRGAIYVATRVVVLCIGVATALSYTGLMGRFVDCFPGLPQRPVVQFPMKMSFVASLNFSLLGAVGLSRMVFKGRGGAVARQIMLVLLGFFILLSTIGLLYSLTLFRSFGFEKSISIVSVLCFGMMFFADLIQSPQEGLLTSLLDASAGGKVVRRILVFVFIIPILVGGIVALANMNGLLDAMQAILFIVIITLLSLSLMVIGQGKVILIGEKRLYESWLKYHELFEHMFDGVIVFQVGMADGRFVTLEINDAAAALLGSKIHDVLGKEILEAFPCMAGTQILTALRKAQLTHLRQFEKRNVCPVRK